MEAEKATFPLELLARKADNFLNSTFTNQPSVQQMEAVNLLEMHSADAGARGIADGQMVRVFNHRGEIFLKARVDGAVQPGVVSARLNWAKLSAGSAEYKRADLRKTFRLGQLRHVLFRLG